MCRCLPFRWKWAITASALDTGSDSPEVHRSPGRAGQFPNEHENLWVAKDGSRRLIAWSNTALNGEDGSLEYVISAGLDITEDRQAEAERGRLLAK